MANRIKTYIPAPTRDSPPDGPILLGNVIASRDVPEECLNSEVPSSFMKNIIPLKAHKIGWKDNNEKQKDISGGVFAQLLQVVGLGGDIEGGRGRSGHDELSAEKIETYWFNPGKEVIDRSVEDSGVQQYLDGNAYHEPVFLITGIMVARGVSATQKSGKSGFFHTQIGVDLTAAGAPVTVGPKGSFSNSREHEVGYESASDFVLAYRLTKIKVTRKGQVSSAKYNTGALYSQDLNQPESDITIPYTISTDFEDVDEEDLDSSGIKIEERDDGSAEIVQ